MCGIFPDAGMPDRVRLSYRKDRACQEHVKRAKCSVSVSAFGGILAAVRGIGNNKSSLPTLVDTTVSSRKLSLSSILPTQSDISTYLLSDSSALPAQFDTSTTYC